MATLTYLTGAAAVAGAATTPALSGLVNGGTLIVTVEATADSGSTLGNPVITDTLGTLTYDDTPNGLTSTIEKNANVTDTDRQCLTAIYTATVGADVTGAVTATVANANVVRVDAFFVDGTVTFVATDTDEGALELIVNPTVGLNDWLIVAFAQSEYSIPSNVGVDSGTTTTYGSLGTGTTSSVSTVLRWRNMIRTDSTASLEIFYESGGGWCHAASALSFTITGEIGGGGGGDGGNAATAIRPGHAVGLLIEAALDESDPLAESHTWTALTTDGMAFDLFRGRQSELVGSEPARASVDNITQDRSLDPDNAAGPYFGALLEMAPARISATYDGDIYRLMYGYIQAYPQETLGGPADVATLTPLEIVDAASILSQTPCPHSEYELRVLQDDPLGYWPLDDSVGGYTRDASDSDFAGELPHGLEQSPVSPYGGNGGVFGVTPGSGVTATNVHPDGDVDVAAIEFIVDPGLNGFPDYSGSGTEPYVLSDPFVSVHTGLASWVVDLRRTYAETGSAGRFIETTAIEVYWTDGTNDRYSGQVELARVSFSDAATQGAALEKYRASIANSIARKSAAASREAARILRNLEVWAWTEAATGRDASGTLDLARQQRRNAEQAARTAESAAEDAKAARVLAAQSAAQLALLDVAREDFQDPIHVVARITSGTLQVWADGALKVSTTATGTGSSDDHLSSGNVELQLNPRGCALGHVAAYQTDLDPQSILEHSVAAKTGLGLQLTGQRLRMVLKAIGWPDAATDIDDGHSYVAGSPTGSVQSYLDQLIETEQGRSYVDGSGRLVFRDRGSDLTATTAVTSQATLSDSLADTGSVWYSTIVTIPAGQDTIINDVIAAREAGTPQRRYVPRAQRRATFTRTYSSLPLHSDLVVRQFADHILRRHKDRVTRFSQVTIHPQHGRQTAATVWPFVLGVQPGWRVTVKRTPQGVGAAINQACTVEGVEHRFTAGGVWETVLYLVPAQDSASAHPWFVIGDATLGRIGAAAGNHVPY